MSALLKPVLLKECGDANDSFEVRTVLKGSKLSNRQDNIEYASYTSCMLQALAHSHHYV
jgi:hypothetical protein